MNETSLTASPLGAQGDRLAVAFDAACALGDLHVASVLLTELDVVLLAEPMRPDQRAAGLRYVREAWDRLQALRAAARRPGWRVRRVKARQVKEKDLLF